MLIDDTPGPRDGVAMRNIIERFGIDLVHINPFNLGVFGSIMTGWSLLPTATEYIFHLENDFVFTTQIEVSELKTVLDEPSIVNITLLRQPWYEDEREAGGVLKVQPHLFRDAVIRGVPVCLHQQYFGHNPGLYRRSAVRIIADTSRGPDGTTRSHERIYRDLLIAEDPRREFAIYGRSTDPPRVHHIGLTRVGHSPDHRPNVDDEESVLLSEQRFGRRAASALHREIESILAPAIDVRLREWLARNQ